MNSLGKITVLLTILLLIFCYHATRADRTELTTLPEKNLDRTERIAKEFGLSIEAGGSLASIMRLTYSDLDLQKMESTWTRLLRETIALNEGLVANANPAELHDPAANRVEPGTTLQLPAIAAVEEGDTGISRVLIRLNPKLKGNGRALIGAIKATINANADLIRKADVNQLRDGRFNVIVVGDILILPPDVLPHTPAHHPVQQPAMVAKKTTENATLPTSEEKLEETAHQEAAVVVTEPEETEATLPTGEEKPVEIASQVAASVLPEPEETEATLPAGEEKPVEIAGQVAASVLPEPEETEATLPAGEEKPVETAEQVAAVVESLPEQAEAAPLEMEPVAVAHVDTDDPADPPLIVEPFPVIAGSKFENPIGPTGPIGLTAWETRRPAKPVKKTDLLAGGNLLLAYLLAGLALLGLFVILLVRWLERDSVFREQFNLLFGAAVFLITFGRVRIKPLVEVTAEDKDRLPIPDQEGKQET